jgi:hypothetical protein
MNLRALKAVAFAVPLLMLAAACTDPTVSPKSSVSGANIWNTQSSYAQYMARLYGGLILTGQVGPDGNPDIQQIDEGTSEFLRLYWYLQELPTDEAVIGWNDPGVPNLVRWQWAASNPAGTISNAMYYRVYFQVVLANEFLRQTTTALLDSRGVGSALKADIQNYRAEARWLRAFAYWVGMDMYGGIPLVTEADPIGGAPAKQVSRDSIYRYVVSELNAIRDSLPDPAGATTYGRATKPVDDMLLAEVYLNAGVYTGTPDYADALTEAANVINSGYFTLNPVFADNFTADNNISPEIIFPAIQDGNNTQTWGGMTFMVHAGCGGSMQASWFGMDYCWGGYRMKQQAYRLFGPGDKRGAFIYDSVTAVDTTTAMRMRDSIAYPTDTTKWTKIDHSVHDSVIDIGNFGSGAAYPKFTNKTSTGGNGQQPGMVDADFPIFRLGETYLIYAEAAVRTGTNLGQALTYFNALRERAYGDATHDITAGQMTLDTILAERGRELMFEARRRTDLIRFGEFTGGQYLWAWKGNVAGGTSTSDACALYPLPQNEITANPNLTQNPACTP